MGKVKFTVCRGHGDYVTYEVNEEHLTVIEDEPFESPWDDLENKDLPKPVINMIERFVTNSINWSKMIDKMKDDKIDMKGKPIKIRRLGE